MRVHRSYIVSLDKINALAKNSILINKLKITIGELYKETFKIVVDKWIK